MYNVQFGPGEAAKKRDAFTAVFYVIVFVVAGLPVWMLTTSTYRASLPLAEIKVILKAPSLSVAIKLNIICFEPITQVDDLLDFENKLFRSLRDNHSFNDKFVTFQYFGYVRPASAKEWQAYIQKKTKSEVESLVTLDGDDDIYIIILPKDTTWINNDENGYVRSKSEKNIIYIKMAAWEKMRMIVESLVNNLVVSNDYLNHVYKAVSEIPPKEKLYQIPNKIRSLFTRVRTASTYFWTFSLVVPFPSGGPIPEWNFSDLENLYLEPLRRKLSGYVNIKISSQLIYGVRLERLWPPRRISSKTLVYSKEDITHVVNGLETYLGSSNDDNSHFVTYIASMIDQQQLHLEEAPGTQSKLDSFIVPRWGGLVILNNVTKIPLDGDALMKIFLPQIRSLMGLTNARGKLLVPCEDTDNSRISSWSVNNWLRERTVENLALVSITLHSVADLLDKVANMVIRDDVAADIRKAVRLSEMSRTALGSPSDNLAHAFILSQKALQAAEAAFFHPSLLELLYFQDDQKYGIYIPLFVPVLLPLFFAVLKIKPFLSGLIKKKTE